MRTIIYIAMYFGLVLFGVTGVAQTPDGLTPAVEVDCDGLIGSEFGLCNAYCEAMDCELRDDDDPVTEPNATDQACDRVLANYRKAVGDGTALPPCRNDPCFANCNSLPDNACAGEQCDAGEGESGSCQQLEDSGLVCDSNGSPGEN